MMKSRVLAISALSMMAAACAEKPHVVARNAKPEVIVTADRIFIDKKEVIMGQHIDIWKRVIPGEPRCNAAVNVACDWDASGITLLTKDGLVDTFELHFIIRPWLNLVTHSPSGKPFNLPPDPRPKNPFRGYLELDGYGIDAETQFRNIRDNVNAANQKRNVRCDLFTNNCGSTIAYFSKTATIYFSLDQTTSERGTLSTFAIARKHFPPD
jgi:hypothetical protein